MKWSHFVKEGSFSLRLDGTLQSENKMQSRCYRKGSVAKSMIYCHIRLLSALNSRLCLCKTVPHSSGHK